VAKRQDWIKVHTRDLRDPDVRALSRAHRDVYREIQLLSKDYSEENGYLISLGKPMSDEQVAKALGSRTPAEIVEAIEGITACIEHGLLERVEASGLHIVYWDLLQAAELREDPRNVAARGRKFRANRAAANKAAEKAARDSAMPTEDVLAANVTRIRRDHS